MFSLMSLLEIKEHLKQAACGAGIYCSVAYVNGMAVSQFISQFHLHFIRLRVIMTLLHCISSEYITEHCIV